MSVFSGPVQARIFKCGAYICRMSDCIVGLRLRFMAFIFLFLSIFLSFPILHVSIKHVFVGIFSGTFKARILKLGIHMDNELLYCGIENGTPCCYSSLCPFVCPLRINLCHSFLRNCAS